MREAVGVGGAVAVACVRSLAGPRATAGGQAAATVTVAKADSRGRSQEVPGTDGFPLMGGWHVDP